MTRDPAEHTSSSDPLSKLFDFLRQHPALLGSLVYLQITSIGIIYSWTLYSEFEINIFDFAEANDFLLAALKEPFAFIMALLTVAILAGQLVWLMLRRRRREQQRGSATSYPKLVLWMFAIATVVYTAVPAHFFARLNANRIVTGSASEIRLRYLQGSSGADLTERHLTLIGTTEKFSFFWDRESRSRLVVPIGRIVSIEFTEEE